MRQKFVNGTVTALSALFLGLSSSHASAGAGRLRIVDWNIEADIGGVTTPRTGFNTVLQGMGNELISGSAQPIDILALEETTSNSTTVQPILNMLNGDYAGANYMMSAYQASVSGNNPTNGNGPNAVVYNANAVKLVSSTGVGAPLGAPNGEYRQVVRYEFQPIGGATSFYLYVSHMKSGTTFADANARGLEASIIRTDELSLPAGSSVICSGDLNSNPPEAEFTNFTAAGPGQLFDPDGFSTSISLWSDSTTSLRYRDDYQLVTQNILAGAGAITYMNGSLEAFGNDGTTAANGSVNNSTNTDLAYMTSANGYNPTQSQILSALTTASDHLPNVADYTFAEVPEPAGSTILLAAATLVLTRSKRAH
jgi:endonuclease/exonuclease/phosphatase family metal-dependent hydrolase